MGKEPQISIIVPVHNAAMTLDRCIESIVNQDYDNIECILVENGSIDSSLEICRKYERAFDWIKCDILPKAGTSAARNRGLSLAHGDIIGFCDADDLLEINALRIVASEFMNHLEIAGVIGALCIGQDTTTGIQKHYIKLSHCKLVGKDIIPMVIADDAVMGSVWNKYYRANVLRGIVFDESLSYCEDMYFNVNVLSRMAPESMWQVIDSPVYCYVQNTCSVTHQMNRIFDGAGNLEYIVTIKKIMNDFELDSQTRSIAKMKIASLAVDYLYRLEMEEVQRQRLQSELHVNFRYLVQNVRKYNVWSNLKRIAKAVLIFGNMR